MIQRFQHFIKLLGLHPSKVYLQEKEGKMWFMIYFYDKEMTLKLFKMKQNPELIRVCLKSKSGKLGFLAGLYDSEGSLKHKERRDRPTPQHLACITLTDINLLKVVYSFAKEFGFRVGIYRYNRGGKYKDEYSLQFNGNKSTFEFLQSAKPIHPLRIRCSKCDYPKWYKSRSVSPAATLLPESLP